MSHNCYMFDAYWVPYDIYKYEIGEITHEETKTDY